MCAARTPCTVTDRYQLYEHIEKLLRSAKGRSTFLYASKSSDNDCTNPRWDVMFMYVSICMGVWIRFFSSTQAVVFIRFSPNLALLRIGKGNRTRPVMVRLGKNFKNRKFLNISRFYSMVMKLDRVAYEWQIKTFIAFECNPSFWRAVMEGRGRKVGHETKLLSDTIQRSIWTQFQRKSLELSIGIRKDLFSSHLTNGTKLW